MFSNCSIVIAAKHEAGCLVADQMIGVAEQVTPYVGEHYVAFRNHERGQYPFGVLAPSSLRPDAVNRENNYVGVFLFTGADLTD